MPFASHPRLGSPGHSNSEPRSSLPGSSAGTRAGSPSGLTVVSADGGGYRPSGVNLGDCSPERPASRGTTRSRATDAEAEAVLSPRSVAHIHTQEAAALLLDSNVCTQRPEASQQAFQWLRESGLRGFWKRVAEVTSSDAAAAAREAALEGVEMAEAALVQAGEGGGGTAQAQDSESEGLGPGSGEELLGGMFAPLPLSENNPSTGAVDVMLDRADAEHGAAQIGRAPSKSMGNRQLAKELRSDHRTAAAIGGSRSGSGPRKPSVDHGADNQAAGQPGTSSGDHDNASVSGLAGREHAGTPLDTRGMQSDRLKRDVTEPRLLPGGNGASHGVALELRNGEDRERDADEDE